MMIGSDFNQNGTYYFNNERIRQLENENFQLQERVQQAENEIRLKCQRMARLQNDADEAHQQYQELLAQVVNLKVSNTSVKEKSTKTQNEMQKKILDLQSESSELRVQLQDKDIQIQKLQTNAMKEHEELVFFQTIVQKISSFLNIDSGSDDWASQIFQTINMLITPKSTTSKLTQTNNRYRNISVNTDPIQTQPIISPPVVITPITPQPMIQNQNIDSIASYSPSEATNNHIRKHRKPSTHGSVKRSQEPQSESYIHKKRKGRNFDENSEFSHRSDPRFRFDRIDSDIGTDIPLEKFIQMHKKLREEEQNSFRHSRFK